jgi:membrane fusion protein, heavy metal efflux system
MTRKALLIITGTLLALGGCGPQKPAAETPEQAEKAPDRTTLSDEAARTAGVVVETAGPARLSQSVDVSGRIEITPEGKVEVRAWYPGRIMAMTAELGQRVRKGQVLARVESNESLQTYAIPAPISGIVMEKNASVGGVAYEQPLYLIADPDALHAEFFLFPRDAEKVRAGQGVEVSTLGGETKLMAKVEAVMPGVDPRTQTMMAHVHLPKGAEKTFRVGLGVEGRFMTSTQDVALAVKSEALQTFDGQTVAFVKSGTTYAARPVTVGQKTREWTQILSGLSAGDLYVAKGAFLIRADIEKSGAEHEH